MNANIFVPMVAPILTSAAAPLITFRKIINMAVAMTEAAVVKSADKKVKMAMGRVSQRVKVERGERKIERKDVQADVRKSANIQWEARRMRVRAWTMLEGRATCGND